jgi:hypothetical protein
MSADGTKQTNSIGALTSVTDAKADIGPLISVSLFLSELVDPPPAAP